jgi:hypothetical protein
MSEFWDTPEEKRTKLFVLNQIVEAYNQGWKDGYKSGVSELDYELKNM